MTRSPKALSARPAPLPAYRVPEGDPHSEVTSDTRSFSGREDAVLSVPSWPDDRDCADVIKHITLIIDELRTDI